MLRIVADTNILISAFISSGAPRKVFELALKGKLVLIASPETLKEFTSVISRERFGFPKAVVSEMTSLVETLSIIVEPKEKLRVVKRDPKDDLFLECAIAGEADYIVTGDEDMLCLKEFKGIKVLRAEELLRLL